MEESEIHRIRRQQMGREVDRLANLARDTVEQAKAFTASPEGKEALAEITATARRLS